MHWFLNKIKGYYPKEIEKIRPEKNNFSNFSEALTTYLSYIEFGGLLFLEKKEEKLPEGISGFILKSSGTTGKPKLVLYSFDQFLEKFRDAQFNPIKTIMIMGLNHIGGMDVFFSVVSRGGEIIFPSKVTPQEICQIVEREKIEFLSLSPTFLNLILLSNSHKKYNISSLKIINFGAETMPSSLLDKARNELPNTNFRQTFGTTETGTMTVVRHPENPLLIKIPNSKIIDSKLYIKSTHGMIGYLGEDSPIEDGYFPSGDVVEEHGDYIRILGRQTDVVNIGGEKVLLTEVEDALLGHPNVQDAIVSSEKNAIMGNILVAQIVWNASSDCKKDIRQYLENKYKKCFIPTKIKVVNEIPHSARFKKIRGL